MFKHHRHLMIVALTGTPGTGKTSVSEILRKKGYAVVDLNRVVKQHNFVFDYDKERKCRVADIKKIDDYIQKQNKNPIIVEGHIAHLLSVDTVIVLRCSPRILSKRLKKKKYDKKKILENAEAEAVDAVTVEALERCKNVYEIDTTKITQEKVAEDVEKILGGKFKNYKVGNVDWSEEILTWY